MSRSPPSPTRTPPPPSPCPSFTSRRDFLLGRSLDGLRCLKTSRKIFRGKFVLSVDVCRLHRQNTAEKKLDGEMARRKKKAPTGLWKLWLEIVARNFIYKSLSEEAQAATERKIKSLKSNFDDTETLLRLISSSKRCRIVKRRRQQMREAGAPLAAVSVRLVYLNDRL